MASVTLSYNTLYLIGILLLFSLGINYYLYEFRTKIKKYANNVRIRTIAKKKNLPIIEVIDSTGTEDEFLGLTSKGDDTVYKKYKNIALHIVPSLFGAKTPSSITKDGIRKYRYFFNFHFPVDFRGAFSLTAIKNHIRDNYPNFDIIADDLTVIRILFTDASDLYDDLKRLIQISSNKNVNKKSEKQIEDDIKQIMTDIEKIKIELPNIDIPSGYYNLAEGMSLIPISVTGQDIMRYGLLSKAQEHRKLNDSDIKKQWIYIYMALALLGGVAVVMYVISKFVE